MDKIVNAWIITSNKVISKVLSHDDLQKLLINNYQSLLNCDRLEKLNEIVY
jgi:hypothetical protein